MDQDAKKTALRMIPYGIYVLTADDGKGNVAAATVNWVTQTAFAPPLVVVGVKTDSGAYQIIKGKKAFALNMLGKDQKGAAFTFFKPTTLENGKLSGQGVHSGATGAPILDAAPAAVECRVTSIVEQGDHHIIVGEVVEAHLPKPITGRPDAAILEMIRFEGLIIARNSGPVDAASAVGRCRPVRERPGNCGSRWHHRQYRQIPRNTKGQTA
jgi:flavin reductase (DIM6/NTAB) family NADH-FMN oxidoreductase RutF